MARILNVGLIALALVFPQDLWGSVRFSSGWAEMGTVEVGQSRSRSLYLRNTGQEDVTVNVSDSCFGDFWVTDSCFGRLGRGSSCHINVRFSPRRAGRQSCSISARDDKGGSDRAQVSGTGRETNRRR